MSGDQALSIAIGALLIVSELAVVVFRRREVTQDIYRWYNSLPEMTWGPAWIRWRFRPSLNQAAVINWLVALLAFTMGAAFLLWGFGIWF